MKDSQSSARRNLLTLSFEPMLAFQLDGPIEFWNTGAERLAQRVAVAGAGAQVQEARSIEHDSR